jgi:hypothetical protein
VDVIEFITWLPEIGFAPDQAPDAEQLSAYSDDQLSVVEPPLCRPDGEAISVVTGASGAPLGPVVPDEALYAPPPQAATATGTSDNRNHRPTSPRWRTKVAKIERIIVVSPDLFFPTPVYFAAVVAFLFSRVTRGDAVHSNTEEDNRSAEKLPPKLTDANERLTKGCDLRGDSNGFCGKDLGDGVNGIKPLKSGWDPAGNPTMPAT